MVRVPTPATQGPQDLGGMETVAAQTPFQQTQLPDLSFNARQLSRVGEALGNVASEFGRRERETVLLEAQRDINDWRNGIFNPDSGVLREEGGNAIGATDRTIASAEQFAGIMEQRYGSRLGPSGRLALRTLLQQETQSVATRVISHETGQRREYEVTLLQANIEDALDQITSNPTNDEVFNQQVGRILTSTTQASVLSGRDRHRTGQPCRQPPAGGADGCCGRSCGSARRPAVPTARRCYVAAGGVLRPDRPGHLCRALPADPRGQHQSARAERGAGRGNH
jgi:hypothetical protein